MIWIFVLAFIYILYSIHREPKFKGWIGEKMVSGSLRSRLSSARYFVYDDVYINVNGATVQIDHVVASEYGVFIIETKKMSGTIVGKLDASHLVQRLGSNQTPVMNPYIQNAKHTSMFAEKYLMPKQSIHSIVIDLGTADWRVPGLVVKNIEGAIKEITSKRRRTLSLAQLKIARSDMEAADHRGKRVNAEKHVSAVNKKIESLKKAPLRLCPKCGNTLVSRSNGSFYGCSTYPVCSHTQK